MLLQKKTLPLTLFLLFVSFVSAQDTITKRNSEIIIAKILEITPTEIKYKKFSFQDGPTYVDKKSAIKMIVYANGMKETFEEEKPVVISTPIISKPIELDNTIEDHKMFYIYHDYKIGQPQMQSILMQTKDKKNMQLVTEAQKARKRETIFIATFPLAIGGLYALTYAGITSSYGNGDPQVYRAVGVVAIAAAIACPITSIINKHKKMNANSAAIKLYNQKY